MNDLARFGRKMAEINEKQGVKPKSPLPHLKGNTPNYQYKNDSKGTFVARIIYNSVFTFHQTIGCIKCGVQFLNWSFGSIKSYTNCRTIKEEPPGHNNSTLMVRVA